MRNLNIGPGWVAMMCALYYVNPMDCFWPFLAAMVGHELGHAAMLLCLRVPVKRMQLNVGGAVMETGVMDYRREFLCALAGPMANLLSLCVRRQFPMFATVSLCLAAFNLLPFPPLDGGNALRAALLLRFDQKVVVKLMTTTALVFGLVLAACSIWISVHFNGGIWPVFVAALTLLRVGLSIVEERKNGL